MENYVPLKNLCFRGNDETSTLARGSVLKCLTNFPLIASLPIPPLQPIFSLFLNHFLHSIPQPIVDKNGRYTFSGIFIFTKISILAKMSWKYGMVCFLFQII